MIEILIIEDDSEDSLIIRELLGESGETEFSVTCSPRLGEALPKIESRRFDAILLDPGLPDANGLEAIPRIRKAAPDVPLVVLTGHSDAAFADQALAAGAQDYLIKGRINGESLVHALRYAVARQGSERGLRDLAHRDSLTDLPNRRLFLDRLEQELVRARRYRHSLGLLFLDIDRLKMVNDTFGHDVGDLLLRGVADRLRSLVRASDTVARLAGDEFTLILPELSRRDDLGPFAEKVRSALRPPFLIAGHSVTIGTSIGASVFPDDALDAETLVKHADASMFSAKRQGGDSVRFYSALMNAMAAERMGIASALRHALDRREFRLEYQPQHELTSGRVLGFECLLRWRHPSLGEIPPLRFLPVAEETHEIEAICDWVLQSACAQLRSWHRHGFPDLTVAVNLSLPDLDDKKLPDRIGRTLRQIDLDPACLEVDLPERGMARAAGQSSGTLRRLRDLGIRVAIDDFGTGHTSLFSLQGLHADTLKIDTSIIKDVVSRPESRSIVNVIIGMAHGLGMRALAEGVETGDQMRILREARCDLAQGYHFSRPLDAGAVPRFLQWAESTQDRVG